MAHVVGTDVADDAVLWSNPDKPRMFARYWPRDETWFVLSTDSGSSSGNDLAVGRDGDYALTQLVDGHEHERNAIGVRKHRLYAVTDAGAARYRLAVFDLETGAQTTLVPEHP